MKVWPDENGNIISNMLVKVQSMEHLKEFQQGHLYMKNLKFFCDAEKNGVGDEEEGLVGCFSSGKLLIDDIVVADVGEITIRTYEKAPIMCFIDVSLVKIEQGRYRFIIPKKAIDEFADEEDVEYGLMFINRQVFHERVVDALNKLDIGYKCDKVEYSDEPFLPKKDELYKAAFHKRKLFEHQNEYRFLIDTEVEDNFTLEIGDISDFTIIAPIKEHHDIPIEVRTND